MHFDYITDSDTDTEGRHEHVQDTDVCENVFTHRGRQVLCLRKLRPTEPQTGQEKSDLSNSLPLYGHLMEHKIIVLDLFLILTIPTYVTQHSATPLFPVHIHHTHIYTRVSYLVCPVMC